MLSDILRRQLKIKSDEPQTFLALGIAHQLNNTFPQAIEAFKAAIQLDADFEVAYNSLAMTQKRMGQLELALHNYDAAIKALSRRIVKTMENERLNSIFKHKDTPQSLWLEYAMFGAMYLCSIDNHIEALAWPTGEQAIQEGRTETHAGLYWIDNRSSEGKLTRLFLPNYFNTFQRILKSGKSYSTLVYNRGAVFELLGRLEEANKHYEEAKYFSENAH